MEFFDKRSQINEIRVALSKSAPRQLIVPGGVNGGAGKVREEVVPPLDAARGGDGGVARVIAPPPIEHLLRWPESANIFIGLRFLIVRLHIDPSTSDPRWEAWRRALRGRRRPFCPPTRPRPCPGSRRSPSTPSETPADCPTRRRSTPREAR